MHRILLKEFLKEKADVVFYIYMEFGVIKGTHCTLYFHIYMVSWGTVARIWYLAKAYNHHCFALPFQVTLNCFGIWALKICVRYRWFCRNCSLHKYISTRQDLALFQMLLFHPWIRKETNFLSFPLISCWHKWAFSAENSQRAFLWALVVDLSHLKER